MKQHLPSPATVAKYSRQTIPTSEASAQLICMRKTRDGYRAKGLNQRGKPYKYKGAKRNAKAAK